MDLLSYGEMFARYNRIANERIYEACCQLEDAEYRQPRQGSFGSIHLLLNHMLLGDRIWLSRFTGGGAVTPPLNTVLFDDFSHLRAARAEEDARIEEFFRQADASFFDRSFVYTNSQGKRYEESARVAVPHFFNHQTHHRGQLHVMLSQTSLKPISLDLHRIANP
jgi:uncharacterized damage-inducible protein DinB